MAASSLAELALCGAGKKSLARRGQHIFFIFTGAQDTFLKAHQKSIEYSGLLPMAQIDQLNRIDRNILRELQQDGRISYAELARRVGLTTTPCLERVKRLERAGIIKGYTALIEPRALDAGLVVFVQIRLSRTAQEIFEEFRQAAVALAEVQECYLIAGNFDYLIKARVADMDAYRKFLGETLLTLPGVLESTSYPVMEQVKETRTLPVPFQ
jgi:Lrp/AsnC family leucine-responsive transcriptional regulator